MNHEPLLLIAAFMFGALIGSFLNVCVYRIPRGISISYPARSFCPQCHSTIRWYENVPILGWLFLRGRCAHCQSPIPPLYLIIELLTAALFALVVWRNPFPQSLALWVLISLLIAATFIDLEFYIIPDAISKGGIGAGLVLSLLVPQLHETTARFTALGLSALGVVTGGGILYLVSEFGKLAFGRFKIPIEDSVNFSFEHLLPDDASVTIQDEVYRWSDHFFRKSDKIVLKTIKVQVDGTEYQNVDLIFYHDRLLITNQTIPLEKLRAVTGFIRAAEFPREAMGLGDVKLIAAIGAFLGWQGVLFAIPAAAFIGAGYGLTAILIGKREWSAKIPFGPYLAAGAMLWLFQGKEIVGWYWWLAGGG